MKSFSRREMVSQTSAVAGAFVIGTSVSNGEDTVQFSPTHYVDITATEPRKRLACYAHASQSPDKFYSLQQQVTRMRGIESGHREAESYIRHVQSRDFALPLVRS
jgi:N-acetylglucosamine malate deacetylase 1